MGPPPSDLIHLLPPLRRVLAFHLDLEVLNRFFSVCLAVSTPPHFTLWQSEINYCSLGVCKSLSPFQSKHFLMKQRLFSNTDGSVSN